MGRFAPVVMNYSLIRPRYYWSLFPEIRDFIKNPVGDLNVRQVHTGKSLRHHWPVCYQDRVAAHCMNNIIFVLLSTMSQGDLIL